MGNFWIHHRGPFLKIILGLWDYCEKQLEIDLVLTENAEAVISETGGHAILARNTKETDWIKGKIKNTISVSLWESLP
jgi:hypothetical protein